MGNQQTQVKTPYLIIAIILVVGGLMIYRNIPKSQPITDERILKWSDVTYTDEQGNLKLKEWRIDDIKRQLKEYDETEQYALIAKESGTYECYHCPQGVCHLEAGHVWKYGITRKGEAGRYDLNWMNRMNLKYIIQFRGNLMECLIEEKRKIGLYPLSSDNLAREVSERMARPPGNKTDD